jgi:tRNA(Ile)-lysidine synthase
LLEAFRIYLKKAYLLQPSYHFIVACSGGIDSIVLCELCHQAQLSFAIAHCNFNLRGAESNRDEAFVRNLGEKYQVLVYVKHFDTEQYGVLKKLSIQEAARELRYLWFEELRLEKKAAYVLLAHHANDNLETVLMNFFRGTGLHGLTGMPERVDSAHCLRPLLHHTRKEIEVFAKVNNLQWMEDSSNASSKYTRNFFRNEIIPAVQKVYPQAEENVLATIERLKKTEVLYQQLVHGLLKKLIVEDKGEYKIPVSKLQHYSNTSLPYEVFKKFQFSEKQLPEILKLTKSESGSFIQNEEYRVIKHRKWLIIAPLQELPKSTMVIEENTKKVNLPQGTLQLKKIEKEFFHLNPSRFVAQLDTRAVTFPLLVRRWKEGDYFYPLGLGKKKKLARFFIDQKLAATEKETIWVLESNARILWIIGYRIDDRAKVTESTKNILQLTFTPA